MTNYLELLASVITYGNLRETRAGPAISIFGHSLVFEDIKTYFPAITVKKLQFKSVAEELAGFLRCESDASKMGSDIWLADAKRWSGGTDMGRSYGHMWRKWQGIDQLQKVVETIQSNPTDRRMLVTAWNPSEVDTMCLPPCHYAFQFYVHNNKYLSCMAHMRSVDLVLGLPFDIASYALLLSIIANQTNLTPGNLIMTLGDCHIYKNHLKQVQTIQARTPKPPCTLELAPTATIDNFTADMAKLKNYISWPKVDAKLNVG